MRDVLSIVFKSFEIVILLIKKSRPRNVQVGSSLIKSILCFFKVLLTTLLTISRLGEKEVIDFFVVKDEAFTIAVSYGGT